MRCSRGAARGAEPTNTPEKRVDVIEKWSDPSLKPYLARLASDYGGCDAVANLSREVSAATSLSGVDQVFPADLVKESPENVAHNIIKEHFFFATKVDGPKGTEPTGYRFGAKVMDPLDVGTRLASAILHLDGGELLGRVYSWAAGGTRDEDELWTLKQPAVQLGGIPCGSRDLYAPFGESVERAIRLQIDAFKAGAAGPDADRAPFTKEGLNSAIIALVGLEDKLIKAREAGDKQLAVNPGVRSSGAAPVTGASAGLPAEHFPEKLLQVSLGAPPRFAEEYSRKHGNCPHVVSEQADQRNQCSLLTPAKLENKVLAPLDRHGIRHIYQALVIHHPTRNRAFRTPNGQLGAQAVLHAGQVVCTAHRRDDKVDARGESPYSNPVVHVYLSFSKAPARFEKKGKKKKTTISPGLGSVNVFEFRCVPIISVVDTLGTASVARIVLATIEQATTHVKAAESLNSLVSTLEGNMMYLKHNVPLAGKVVPARDGDGMELERERGFPTGPEWARIAKAGAALGEAFWENAKLVVDPPPPKGGSWPSSAPPPASGGLRHSGRSGAGERGDRYSPPAPVPKKKPAEEKPAEKKRKEHPDDGKPSDPKMPKNRGGRSGTKSASADNSAANIPPKTKGRVPTSYANFLKVKGSALSAKFGPTQMMAEAGKLWKQMTAEGKRMYASDVDVEQPDLPAAPLLGTERGAPSGTEQGGGAPVKPLATRSALSKSQSGKGDDCGAAAVGVTGHISDGDSGPSSDEETAATLAHTERLIALKDIGLSAVRNSRTQTKSLGPEVATMLMRSVLEGVEAEHREEKRDVDRREILDAVKKRKKHGGGPASAKRSR